MKNIKLSNLLLCAILLLTLLHGCKKEKGEMSPEDVVTMFYKARDAGDFETLNEILFFESEVSASQREKKIQSIISTSSEKTTMKMFAANIETQYEKILDNETAEVGVVVKAGIAGVGKNMPFNQIMLRKQDGRWKYHYSRNSLTIDELIQEIKKYPDDASLYYLLGKLVRNDNPFEGYRFCQKYYDLEPDGFWVSKEFLSKLEEDRKKYGNAEDYEKRVLREVANEPDFRSGSKCRRYVTLAQFFTQQNNYSKAELYLTKAEELYKKDPAPFLADMLKEAKKELEERKEGKIKYQGLLEQMEKID